MSAKTTGHFYHESQPGRSCSSQIILLAIFWDLCENVCTCRTTLHMSNHRGLEVFLFGSMRTLAGKSRSHRWGKCGCRDWRNVDNTTKTRARRKNVQPSLVIWRNRAGFKTKIRRWLNDRRDEQTLLPLNKDFVLPGSIIYSDWWKAYENLSSFYVHHCIIIMTQ